MWNEKYEKLSKYDQGEFSRLANYLLSHTYLVRDIYRVDLQYTQRSEDYRKVNRMFELLQDYFAVADFKLEKDDNYGVYRLLLMGTTVSETLVNSQPFFCIFVV